MSWNSKYLGVARRSTQQRFRIFLEQLDFFSKEFQDANSEDNQYLSYKDGFAQELLNVIGDDISIADIRQIVSVFSKELDTRLAEKN